ncbi:MAG: hypothetical protein RBU28_07645, partial [Bacteroidales bacterium]|nr:hypothetical protein [Bacteroidales bacterium]
MSQIRPKSNNAGVENKNNDEPFAADLKKTGNLTVFAFLCLIAGLILITFKLFLPAGLLVI